MKALIYLIHAEDPLETRESYATIKRRLFDNQPFMEVTRKAGGKVIFDKAAIWQVGGYEETKGKKPVLRGFKKK